MITVHPMQSLGLHLVGTTLAGTPLPRAMPHKCAVHRRVVRVRPHAAARAWEADFEKEEWLKERRRWVYEPNNWHNHRSPWRYVRHARSMWSSTVLRALWKPALLMTILTLLISVYDTARTANLLPAWFPCIFASAHIPFLLCSPALSLLLVFRTNASYGRYAEARAKFGGLTRRCRDLIRQALQWYAPTDKHLLKQLVRLNAALPRVLLWSCRSGRNLRKDLTRQKVLLEHEIDMVCAGQHPVSTLMTMMTMAIAAAHITPFQKLAMDRNMTHLIDCMGDCETMLQTPIPLAYTRHTCRFLCLWLLLVPLVFWKSCGWLGLPACIAVCFTFLGIEEIGVTIEEPFYTLPLETIATNVPRDILSIAASAGLVMRMVDDTAGGPVLDVDDTHGHGRGDGRGDGHGDGYGKRKPDAMSKGSTESKGEKAAKRAVHRRLSVEPVPTRQWHLAAEQKQQQQEEMQRKQREMHMEKQQEEMQRKQREMHVQKQQQQEEMQRKQREMHVQKQQQQEEMQQKMQDVVAESTQQDMIRGMAHRAQRAPAIPTHAAPGTPSTGTPSTGTPSRPRLEQTPYTAAAAADGFFSCMGSDMRSWSGTLPSDVPSLQSASTPPLPPPSPLQPHTSVAAPAADNTAQPVHADVSPTSAQVILPPRGWSGGLFLPATPAHTAAVDAAHRVQDPQVAAYEDWDTFFASTDPKTWSGQVGGSVGAPGNVHTVQQGAASLYNANGVHHQGSVRVISQPCTRGAAVPCNGSASVNGARTSTAGWQLVQTVCVSTASNGAPTI